MAYERRDFTGTASAQALTGDVGALDETFNIASGDGWPTGGIAGAFLGRAESETILFESRTGNTLAVADGGRGYEGTTATDHASGVLVEHIGGATDFDEANLAVSKTIGEVPTSGYMLISDAANSLTGIDVRGSGQILVGNGTTSVMRTISGDATLSSAGVLALTTDSVDQGNLAANSVGTSEIIADSVTTDELADNSVDSNHYVDGSIDREHLAADVIDGSKLEDDAVNTEHIAADAVLGDNIADNQIVNAHLTDDCVDTAELADAAVETLNIADENVTLAKIANEEWSTYAVAMGSQGGGSAPGDGTLVGRYTRIGRTVHVQASLVLGASTNFGSGTFTMSLPVSCNDSSTTMCIGSGLAINSGTANHNVHVICVPGTDNDVVVFSVDESIYVKGESGGLPFGWGTGDTITWSATYEAAT